jgi:hypothetical protein
MTRRDVLIRVLALGLVAGCGESTAPYARSSGIRVEPLVPLYGAGYRETEVADLPAVKITDFSSGTAIKGRAVVFTFDTDDGVKTPLTVLTGSDGIARLPSWRLGRDLGRYAVTAVTDGWGPITFTVIVPGDVVAIYDLKSFNGAAVAADKAGYGGSHLVLYEVGLYNDFVGRPAQAFTAAPESLGSYSRSGPDMIVFSTQCSFIRAPCDARGMLGVVRGAELIVAGGEWPWDSWDAVYELRSTPAVP